MVCQTCGGPLSAERRQKLFCSIACRNSANGKKSGGHNRVQHVAQICENCGRHFSVPPSRAAKTNVRACSRPCLGALQSRERQGWFAGSANANWRGGIQTYRRFRKDACERCGSDRHLIVHHKDEDRYNNVPENLETLCKRCHQLHHDCAANLPQNRR